MNHFESNDARQKILIVGGGVAGITLLYFLSQKKYKITLIEKGGTWRTIGYAVGLWKVGIDILKKLPLDKEFWSKTYTVSKCGFLNGKGKILSVLNCILPKNQTETLNIEREILHSAITRILPENADVRFNTTVQNIRNSNSGAVITFHDDTEEFYDLIVAADGVRSMIRSMIFGDYLRFYGWKIWGVWSEKKDAHFDGNYAIRDTGEFLLSIPGQNRCAVGLFFYSQEKWLPAYSPSRKDILEQFPKLKSYVEKIIAAEQTDRIFSDELVYVKMKNWYKDRVILIGDARHGTSPISWWGTSLALEDAYYLGQMLNNEANISEVLKKFSKKRQKELRRVKVYIQAIEWVTLASTKFEVILRNIVLRLTSFLPQKLFEYSLRREKN